MTWPNDLHPMTRRERIDLALRLLGLGIVAVGLTVAVTLWVLPHTGLQRAPLEGCENAWGFVAAFVGGELA